MSLDATGLLDKVLSHAMTTGLFERVNTHEPKNAPGNGLSAAIWCQDISPVLNSGLAATSARVVFTVRIFSNMLQEPQDAIDPNIMSAVDTLINTYSGDFRLDDSVRNVDLLGTHGISLGARAGYINADGKMFRIMDITVPLIVNDVWEQVP